MHPDGCFEKPEVYRQELSPDPAAPVKPVRPRLYVCGEYGNPASLHWAMASGGKAAEALMEIPRPGAFAH